MPTTRFQAGQHGFAFRGCLVRTSVALPAGMQLAVRGRCGGLAYAALDYFYSGLAVPGGPHPAPEPWLTDYLSRRFLHSFSLPSTVRFALWAMAGDESVARTTWGHEIPRLCRAIDSGYPVILGLVRARRLADALVASRQVVASGYELDAATGALCLSVYDAETPGQEVVLTLSESAPWVHASNEERPWRGLFVHDYRFQRPPTGPPAAGRTPLPADAAPLLAFPAACRAVA